MGSTSVRAAGGGPALFTNERGMTIAGQGPWIMLFTAPALVAAVLAQLVLPGVALVTGSWGYLAAAAVLCRAVWTFIGNEERDLRDAFGDEYRRYTERVHRLLPFVRPGRAP